MASAPTLSPDTVKCRYNAVQYNTIFHRALHWLKLNINQCQITNYTPYLALTSQLWGVFCEDLVENWPHYSDTALYIVLLWFCYQSTIELPLISDHNKSPLLLLLLTLITWFDQFADIDKSQLLWITTVDNDYQICFKNKIMLLLLLVLFHSWMFERKVSPQRWLHQQQSPLLTHWPLGDLTEILDKRFSSYI